MSEENERKEIEAAVDNALYKLNELRGNIKAFMLIAMTDEESNKKEDAVRGVNATVGRMKDLVTIFNNINPEIKHAAAIGSLSEILGKVFGENEKSETEKDKGIQPLAPSQHELKTTKG